MIRESGYYRVKQEYGLKKHSRWLVAKWDSVFGWWEICGYEVPYYDEEFY